MKNVQVTLVPLTDKDREQFILDNQWAFKYGAMVGMGDGDAQEEFEGEIISRETIEKLIDAPDGAAYCIMLEDRMVGGAVLKINNETRHNHLELFFVHPDEHSKGIGQAAWCAIEALYPEMLMWETCTPYFEKRNIHFYVNRCGFHVVEFFSKYHVNPDVLSETGDDSDDDEMFRFVKVMK